MLICINLTKSMYLFFMILSLSLGPTKHRVPDKDLSEGWINVAYLRQGSTQVSHLYEHPKV